MDDARRVWFLWFQGLDKAPEVVRRCHESWIHQNPDWEIVTLDSLTVADYVSPELLQGPISRIPLTQRSDVFRLDLLSRFGGVWADASCWCARPLNDWLPAQMDSGFFGFRNPAPTLPISTWFLASRAENAVTKAWREAMIKYWGDHEIRSGLWRVLMAIRPASTQAWSTRPVQRWLRLTPYFAAHNQFARLVATNRAVRDTWTRTPCVSADGPHRLLVEGLLTPPSESIRQEIDHPTIPVYKLSWKLPTQTVPRGSLLEYVLSSQGRANG